MLWACQSLSQGDHKIKADNLRLVVSKPLANRTFHLIPNHRFTYMPFSDRKTQPWKTEFVLDPCNNDGTIRLS